MKIGFFTDSYLPYTSGVVRSIETFTHELRLRGHDVYIFAPAYRKNQVKENDVYRFFSIPSPTNQEFSLAIPFSWQIRAELKHLKLDLIHVHSPFLLGRLGAALAKRLNLPLVYTYHTLYDQYVHYFPFARSLSRWVVNRLSRDFCNRCDLVVAPTAIVGNMLQGMGVSSALQIIPTGIRLEEWAAGDPSWANQQFSLEGSDQILISVGRLGPEKNIEFLLRSFQFIAREEPAVKLLLVGSGPQARNYVALAGSLGLKDRVIFTGRLRWPQLAHCLARSRVFVFASLTETQGLVLAEAQAAGLPIVALKANGVAEMVRHGTDGYLTTQSSSEFAAAVLKLLRDDLLRKQMSAQAIAAASRLEAGRCAERLEEVYLRLLEEKARGAAI